MVHRIGDKVPRVNDALFVAWNAEIAGDVTLSGETSVWFSATIRADLAAVSVGRGSNVQDNSTLHVDTGLPLIFGAGGHGGPSRGAARVHGGRRLPVCRPNFIATIFFI
jgi:carbonic anhydrase/acetyltransferase-like protein (isoleucine patch superfamily)